MNYIYTCKCGTKYKIEEKAIGRLFRCAKCQSRNSISREHLQPAADAIPAPHKVSQPSDRATTSVGRAAAKASIAAIPPSAGSVVVARPAPPPMPSKPAMTAPATASPIAGGVLEFAEPSQWGTMADSFHPAVIYHGTEVRGDISLPMALKFANRSLEINARNLTPRELSSFLIQYIPWVAASLLAPFQHLFGFCVTPFLMVLSIFAPWNYPQLMMEGFGHFIGIFTSTVNVFHFCGQYFRALVARFTKQPFTFVPRELEMQQEGRLATLQAGEVSQVIRLDVSQRLLNRVVRKVKKAEEEEMGLVGIVIGLALLTVFPLVIAFKFIKGALGLFGVGRTKRAMLAVIVGAPVDLQVPTTLGRLNPFARIKKALKDKQAEDQRVMYLLNIPLSRTDEIQRAIEKTLGVPVRTVDDALARRTIWSKYV
ncbi:MAG: hypothetical protein JW959_05240 [Pirellulales bacterium]|nr:hypothetical protein [Pirellulales bacterium]